jgi:hypothetical protein
MRIRASLVLAFALAAGPSSVNLAAARDAWSGVWVGQTQRGLNVSVAVRGREVTSFVFNGAAMHVKSARVSPGAIVMTTGDGFTEFVMQRMAGGAASWSVSDASFGNASAILHRQ